VTMRRNSILTFTIAFVLLGLTAAPHAFAVHKGVAFVEPTARKALQIVNDYLKDADSFTVTIQTVKDEVFEGTHQKIQYAGIHDLAVRRPDRLKIRSRGDLGEIRVWYDGSRMTILDIMDYNIEPDEVLGDNMTYSYLEVPDTIDATLDYVAENYGIAPPLITLAKENPLAILNEMATSGFYVGLNYVGDVLCHHLAYTMEDVDVQLWIENGMAPLIRKIVITYKKEPGFPQFEAYLSDWNFSPHLPDSVFKFFKPKDALLVPMRKIEDEGEEEK